MVHRDLRTGVFQTTTIIAVALLLLILFVSAAYFFTIPGDRLAETNRKTLAELQDRRAVWEERRPAAFRYVIERDCACDAAWREPYVATEESGRRLAEYRRPATSRDAVPGIHPPDPVWIDDLFAIAERAIAEGGPVDIEYDVRYSYPASLSITDTATSAVSQAAYIVIDFEVLDYMDRYRE